MLRKASFWKLFLVVFVTAFLTNAFVSYVWDRTFHDTPLRWDSTSVTAVIAGLLVAYILEANKKDKESGS